MADLREDISHLEGDLTRLNEDMDDLIENMKHHVGVKQMVQADLLHMMMHMKEMKDHLVELTNHVARLKQEHTIGAMAVPVGPGNLDMQCRFWSICRPR